MNKERRKAIAAAIKSLQELDAQAVEEFKSKVEDIKSEIETLKDEEQEYYDSMPENMQGGEKGDAAQNAVSQMESAISSLEEITDADDWGDKINEAAAELEGID